MVSNLLHLAAAYLLALPMAIEREKRARTAGLRTFPLVAMASCGFVLTGAQAFGSEPGANARVLAALMAGIGFVGGGAILKQDSGVRGMATASAIWATGAVGAAVGYSQYDVAIALSLATGVTLYVSPGLKDQIKEGD